MRVVAANFNESIESMESGSLWSRGVYGGGGVIMKDEKAITEIKMSTHLRGGKGFDVRCRICDSEAQIVRYQDKSIVMDGIKIKCKKCKQEMVF